MSAELPPDIVVIETGQGVRYILPRPDLGIARLMGGVLAAFGLVPMAMGAWFALGVLKQFAPFDHPAAVGIIPFGLATLAIILFGCLISLAGIWLLAGHGEIVVTAGEVRSAFRLGPLAWRGRRDRRQVRRLVVERTSHNPTAGADMASLYAETDQGRPLLLAWVYPPGWLVPLAAHLAGRCSDGTDPLPVIERVMGRDSSRRWRRDGTGTVKKPVPGCVLFTWGLIFFLAGVFLFVMILQALVRGDPGNNLQGAYPWKCLWILFPFPFIIPGALVLHHVWRRRETVGLSPEQRKVAEVAAPAAREGAGAIALPPAAPEAEYPTVPAVSHAPGGELSVRLTRDISPGWGVLIFLGLLLLCSGVITPLIVTVVNGLRARDFEYVPIAGFFSLFVGIIWLLLAGVTVKEWREWSLGHPVVELSDLPLYCGETYGLLVTVPGPARFRRLRIAVVCEEEASYTEGTTRRKETRRVYDQELARQEGLVIERGEPLRVRGSLPVPPGAMHSFKAEHNEVRWVVRVEGEAQRLFALKFTHDYPLPVRPPRGYGGKA
jgi:hypothetical protein